MATRHPLLRVQGKLGFYFGAKTVPDTGTGTLTKSKGHDTLKGVKASVTATQARAMKRGGGMNQMSKNVPVEEEAETRARVPDSHQYEQVDKEGR